MVIKLKVTFVYISSYILEARDKPILTMFEEIRMKLMKRMYMKRKVAEKYIGSICPKIVKKLEKYKGLSSNCWATEAGARKYSVAVWKIYMWLIWRLGHVVVAYGSFLGFLASTPFLVFYKKGEIQRNLCMDITP